jgi:AraC family transcriptional activator of pobA
MNGFKVCQIDTATSPVPTYSRRDFYTICLLTGPRQLQCADQAIALDGPCLFLGNPLGAGLEQGEATRQTGYSCRFSAAFFQQSGPVVSQQQWALFSGPAPRAFSLGDEQATYITGLFQKMLAEQQSGYCFKHELLRSYLQLVLHEALRLRTPAPKRSFTYYFRQPGQEGVLDMGRGIRRRRQR